MNFADFMEQETRPEPTDNNLTAFVRRIADGKLLIRYSSMTCNAECDYCHVEEKLVYSPDFPVTMQHKPWCIVTAARRLFPDVVPGNYPDPHYKKLRGWNNARCDESQFDWLGESEYKP